MSLTDEELLKRALAFDGGTLVTGLGYIFDPDDPDDNPAGYQAKRYRIEFRDRGWLIRSNGWSAGNWVLTKNGRWIGDPNPSLRTEEFYEKTTWGSAREAFDFLAAWKAEEVRKAEAAGWKHWRDKEAI